MIGWSVAFLLIALFAAALGFARAGTHADVWWVVFVTSLILAVVFMLYGSHSRR